MDRPIVTVLMPVYNGSAYLRQAINSVLVQSYSNFEFLILDDCSSDDTVSIVRSYSDPRIRLIEAKERLMICKALNAGIEQAKGKYIARMDADDVCRPSRLEKQVTYLERCPQVGVCGTWVRRFGLGVSGSIDKRPCGSENVRAYALFDNPMVHSSVMMRRDILGKTGSCYLDEFKNAEDYELWSRLFACCGIDNIPEVLLDYRVHLENVTITAGKDMEVAACCVVKRLLYTLGLNPTEEDVLFHRYLGTARMYPERSRSTLVKAEEWLKKLIVSNCISMTYFEPSLLRAIAGVWYRACYHSLDEGMWTIRHFLKFYAGSCKGSRPLLVPILFCAMVKSLSCRYWRHVAVQDRAQG